MTATYIVRDKTKSFVSIQLEQVVLQKDHNQYTFNDTASYIITLKRVATGIYNPRDTTYGISRLLIGSMDTTTPITISAIRSTDITNVQSVLTTSNHKANTHTPPTKLDIVNRQNAESATKNLNVNY